MAKTLFELIEAIPDEDVLAATITLLHAHIDDRAA